MIDEKKLIDCIRKSSYENPHKDGRIALNHIYEHQHFINIVNTQPKVGEWIKCDKSNIPEDVVLCCSLQGGQVVGIIASSESSLTGFLAHDGKDFMYDVIAWQPLPEPYKEKGDFTNGRKGKRG